MTCLGTKGGKKTGGKQSSQSKPSPAKLKPKPSKSNSKLKPSKSDRAVGNSVEVVGKMTTEEVRQEEARQPFILVGNHNVGFTKHSIQFCFPHKGGRG